jgi:hypothetical protein
MLSIPPDITYASLAKAFDQPLVHHAETLRRMTELSKHRSWIHTQNQEQRSARQRMALFPANAEALFVARDMWVVSTTICVSLLPSLHLPFPISAKLFRSGILTEISLLTLAGCTAGGETLRLSGHTELVPEDARRVEGVLAAASPFRMPLPTSDLHSVSRSFSTLYFWGGCVLTTPSRSHGLCAI